MNIDEVRAKARSVATGLTVPIDAASIEGLRADATRFFEKVPEPPVYRRRDDPARKVATELLAELAVLLGRAYHLETDARLKPWREALEAHLEALSLLSEGRVEAADEAWQRAVEFERQATASTRLWVRSDERPPAVFHAGTSRYDPQPEPSVQAKLLCPTCRKVGEFSFSPRHATHRFVCSHCQSRFTAYFAEVRSVEVHRWPRFRRYVFRVEELGGAQTRIAFDDSSLGELHAARREFLAFLYAPETVLKGVLNLGSSRVLWLTSSGCFVATVAFGEGAPELQVLRAFRDQVLSRSVAGRAFVSWYYRHGPGLATVVARHPWARRLTRATLTQVVRVLGEFHSGDSE